MVAMVSSLLGARAPRWVSAGTLLGALSLGAFASGCGVSEDVYNAKVREAEDLRNQLAAQQAQSRKAEAELADTKARVEQLKEQLRSAGVDISNLNANLEQQARALEDYKKRAEQLEVIRKRFELLRSKLQELTRFGLNVTVRNNRLVIQLPGDVLFDSGRDTLKKEGRDILKKVADVIRQDPGLNSRNYQVAGHTDAEKLQGGVFKDNWGLSVMRARQVVVFLVDPADKGGGGLSPKRWSASGYGEEDPVAPNDTPANMAKNRRVELVVVPSVEEMLDLKQLTK
jgi:chemotaxis protein MotB